MLAAPACFMPHHNFYLDGFAFYDKITSGGSCVRAASSTSSRKASFKIELENGIRNPSEFIKISFAIGLCGAAGGFALAPNSKQTKLSLSASRHHAGHPRRKWDFIRPVRLQDAFSGNYDKWCRMFLRIFFSLRCSPLIQLINVLLVVFPTSFFIFFFRRHPPAASANL